MSDIVERLRIGTTTEPGCHHPIWSDVEKADATMSEAADEIERLRKALTPFARIADMESDTRAGGSTVVNIDRCRDARAALDAVKEG